MHRPTSTPSRSTCLSKFHSMAARLTRATAVCSSMLPTSTSTLAPSRRSAALAVAARNFRSPASVSVSLGPGTAAWRADSAASWTVCTQLQNLQRPVASPPAWWAKTLGGPRGSHRCRLACRLHLVHLPLRPGLRHRSFRRLRRLCRQPRLRHPVCRRCLECRHRRHRHLRSTWTTPPGTAAASPPTRASGLARTIPAVVDTRAPLVTARRAPSHAARRRRHRIRQRHRPARTSLAGIMNLPSSTARGSQRTIQAVRSLAASLGVTASKHVVTAQSHPHHPRHRQCRRFHLRRRRPCPRHPRHRHPHHHLSHPVEHTYP